MAGHDDREGIRRDGVAYRPGSLAPADLPGDLPVGRDTPVLNLQQALPDQALKLRAFQGELQGEAFQPSLEVLVELILDLSTRVLILLQGVALNELAEFEEAETKNTTSPVDSNVDVPDWRRIGVGIKPTVVPLHVVTTYHRWSRFVNRAYPIWSVPAESELLHSVR